MDNSPGANADRAFHGKHRSKKQITEKCSVAALLLTQAKLVAFLQASGAALIVRRRP